MADLRRRIHGRAEPPDADSSEKAAGSIADADHVIAEGNALEDTDDLDGALARYREAANAAPDYPRAYLNVGNALRKLGRITDAAVAFRQALRMAPDYAPAHFNLGTLLAVSGDYDGAEAELREALRLKPDMVEAPIALADVFESAGRLTDAEIELNRALRIDPDHGGAIFNLGLLHLRENRFEQALDSMMRAKELDPSLQNVESFMLFSLNLRAELDAETVARAHRCVGSAISRAAGPPLSTWENPPDPERKLRIGYVSGDFGFHPVGLFLYPVLERHDRSAVEIHCYSNSNPADADPIQPRLRQCAAQWREIAGVADDDVADLIRADAIDVLVDLSGHTNKNRLAVFARHPAPVQVTWLGYLNTTGLPAMDYRICDWHTDPGGATEHLHAERLYRMPHSQWCYVPWGEVPLASPPHQDRPDAIVFGSFNQYPKLSDACVDLWCRILAELPEAQLVVMDVRDANTRQKLLDRFAHNRIDSARVSLRGRENLAAYYNAISNTDIALDAFPYNGATTTFDTLWMGVPLVALYGDRGISRGGVSILRSLQLPELIADSPDAYVDLNVRLARDASWRSALRSTLRGRLAASSLMDMAGFVRDLEAGYRQMWRNWCAEHR